MAKKKKRRVQTPSLSPLDRGIYFLLMAVFFIAGMFLYSALIGNQRRSVFENTSILAVNSPGIMLALFGLVLGGGLALLMDWLRRKKQPIFGRASITYGPPQWKPVYPLFSKQFWRIEIKTKSAEGTLHIRKCPFGVFKDGWI